MIGYYAWALITILLLLFMSLAGWTDADCWFWETVRHICGLYGGFSDVESLDKMFLLYSIIEIKVRHHYYKPICHASLHSIKHHIKEKIASYDDTLSLLCILAILIHSLRPALNYYKWPLFLFRSNIFRRNRTFLSSGGTYDVSKIHLTTHPPTKTAAIRELAWDQA